MGNNLPEDMVYTITTGFYPELFSGNPSWQAGHGKGRKGMQWKKKRGWSKGSLKKIAGKRVSKKGVSSFFGRLQKGVPWDEAYSKLSGAEKKEFEEYKEQNQGKFSSEAEMQEKLTYTKFMGNSEIYKLWGTKVWWQEGQRKQPDKMESDITAWETMTQRKDLSLYLEKLYSRSETKFIELAKNLAEKVFGDAVDEGNLRSDLESVGQEADVPEEERKEASGVSGASEKPDAIPESFKAISRAREADIKYRMKDGTSLYMDSTEMPLHKGNQHGITEEGAEQMKKAIEEAKKRGKGWKSELKRQVIKMFEKNITMYNKDIKSLITAGGTKKDKKEGINAIKKIMQDIEKQNKSEKSGKKAPDARSTVSQLMTHSGQTMGVDAAKDTSFKYIVHTIVNLAGDANRNFRQGHLVGNIGGQNTYASVPMQLKGMKTGTPQFNKAYMRRGVAILQGENHLLAVQEKDRNLGAATNTETHARQIQAFQNGKIIGVGANGQTHGQANAQTNLRARARQTTTVTFNPKSFESIIDKIPELIGDNTKPDKIRDTAKSFMSKDRGQRLGQKGITKFWAMPYIGLMEYPTKAE